MKKDGDKMTELALHQAPTFAEVAIDDLIESPLNPRRDFPSRGMDELTKSVREKGVLQPILVRSAAPGPGPQRFEIVAGARRFRAAKAAGLRSIPARRVYLTDDEALEVMVVENLQRSDVHPLEEAQGYEALLKRRADYDVPALAAKVGKSEAYVYQRMQLLKLVPAVRKEFLKDGVTPSLALLLARIPAALQPEALRAVGDLSTSAAREEISRRFMLELGTAEFETADPALLPKAGPCTTCPKRTGNQRALFDDVKNGDLCTDPACFESKRAAHARQRLEDARARGLRILDEKQAKKADRDYMDLDQKAWDRGMGGRTPRQILGKQGLAKAEIAAALVPRFTDDEPPQYVELVSRKAVDKALRDQVKSGKLKDPFAVQREADAKRKAARALARAVTTEALQQLRAKLMVAPLSMDLDALVSFVAAHVGSDTYDEAFMDRHGIAERRKQRKSMPDGLEWACDVVQRLGTNAKLAFAVDAILTKATNRWSGEEYDRALVSACKVWGVDLAALEQAEKARRAKKAVA